MVLKTMIKRKTPLKRTNGRITPKKRVARRLGGKKTKLKSISKLIKEADKLFSIQVRMKDCWSETVRNPLPWLNRCFTCKREYPVKKLHCGHYLSRYYKAARWNFDNARPQCMMCNMWKRGDPIVFRRNLIAEIGEARVLAVEKLRDAPIKLSREFLQNKLEELINTSLTT